MNVHAKQIVQPFSPPCEPGLPGTVVDVVQLTALQETTPGNGRDQEPVVRVRATEAVMERLQVLGRTEDIKFSPDCSRLAIAGFKNNRLLILDVTIASSGDGITVHLTDFVQISSTSLVRPHGVSFLDENTLIVTNRRGKVPVFDLPESGQDSKDFYLTPVLTIGSDASDLIESPGSVSVTPLENHRYEIIVCNNYVHYVSRHILDRRDRLQLISSEILVGDGMEIPDGVTVNRNNTWMATSVHDRHCVFVYRRRASLDRTTRPDGILKYINYPHGIRFTPDDRHLIVSDAGTPFVNIYTKTGDDWNGTHHPQAIFRVMDDDTYFRGRVSCQEGGTKGLDIDRDMTVLVTTCEEQVIRFFDLKHVLAQRGIPRDRRKKQLQWYYGRFKRETLALPGITKAWRYLRRLLA